MNAQGESDYLKTDHKIMTEEPPGPPGKPEITDVDKHSVELQWTPPTTKGSPITGYIVEKKEKNGTKWVKALEQNTPDCTAFVPNLIEGREYSFRVRAKVRYFNLLSLFNCFRSNQK